MKRLLFALFFLLVGFAGGAYYGWSTGMIDGAVVAEEPVIKLVDSYNACRGGNDVKRRDQLIDMLTLGLAATFAEGHKTISPMASIARPKAEYGMLSVAATWELNEDLPKVWKEGARPMLYDPGSAREADLKQLKEAYPADYKATLERKRKERAAQAERYAPAAKTP